MAMYMTDLSPGVASHNHWARSGVLLVLVLLLLLVLVLLLLRIQRMDDSFVWAGCCSCSLNRWN